MSTVLHVITDLDDGGAEAVLYRLCTHDRKNRHVVISMMDEGKYGPLLQDAGIDVFCLEMPRRWLTLRGLLLLYEIFRDQCPDVVQTWMYHADLIGGVVARLSGIRSVCWGVRHSTLIQGVSPFSTIFVARVCAFLSCFVPRSIVCCSQKALSVHRNLGYQADKLVCIPNGYDIDLFKPNSDQRKTIRDELEIREDIPLLGMVARYDPQKDHVTLFEALNILNLSGVEFHFLLIGTDMNDMNENLKSLAMKFGLISKISFLGRRIDIPSLMNAIDIHVLSSSFGEAFPNVVAEAMACGTPCVATNVGDTSLIVGETGWIVPPQNTEALARAICAAIENQRNDKQWQERCFKARERIVANFEINSMVNRFGECWGR